jgi:flagellar biosynthesis GTPase FlhF
MILNKFLDKTFEAAKQSALQIYGDDYSHLKDILPKEEQEEQNRGSQKRKRQQSKSASEKKSSNPKTKGGVVFERSTQPKQKKEQSSSKKLDQKLESIRKYAAQQENKNSTTSVDKKDATDDATPPATDSKEESGSAGSLNNVYSRKDIRNQKAAQKPDTRKKSTKQEFDTVTLNNMQPSSNNEQDPLYDKFVEELPNGVSPVKEAAKDVEENKDSEDIHKRLDRLESLMHLALSTPDTAYSEQPLFHKLLHKGVSQKLIRQWFESIIEQGIQPAQQPKLFHSKLLQRIDELLQQSKADTPNKIQLFAGRSGAGKTHLIMKLASLSALGENKTIAIASFMPQTGSAKNRYSILEPFCSDQDVDFFPLQSADQISTFAQKWEHYDHILIDTPPLEIDGQALIEEVAELQTTLQQHAPTETHYLVNTAVNGTAFNDPLAKDISADHIALTHIDQSLKWGKTIQLLANTRYNLRYISSGPSISGDLVPFDPEKFARKLLRT